MPRQRLGGLQKPFEYSSTSAPARGGARSRAEGSPNPYSYLNTSTGFLVAALQLCQLIVRIAIIIAENPAAANIHQLISVLYANLFIQTDMSQYETGTEINIASMT